jgi:hypothetical protein
VEHGQGGPCPRRKRREVADERLQRGLNFPFPDRVSPSWVQGIRLQMLATYSDLFNSGDIPDSPQTVTAAEVESCVIAFVNIDTIGLDY